MEDSEKKRLFEHTIVVTKMGHLNAGKIVKKKRLFEHSYKDGTPQCWEDSEKKRLFEHSYKDGPPHCLEPFFAFFWN